MSTPNKTQRLYNPKSHAPAVYIPCWLIQVSTKLISNNAKMLYGRLSQWANEKCQVFRSSKQLAEELGTPQRTIERHLLELRECKLINTIHPQAGGVNHFEFLHHEWMDCDINKHLVYAEDTSNPPPKMAVPPAKNGGTLPPKMADINKKEIKVNKKTTQPLIFSCFETLKTHFHQVLKNRGKHLSTDLISQVLFWINGKDDKAFDAVNKQINYAIKAIEQGKWQIPHGYDGITTQSIREKEEKQQIEKQVQQQQDGAIARNIRKAVLSGQGADALSLMKNMVR